MKARWIIASLVALLILPLATLLVLMLLNPACRPLHRIHAAILDETPLRSNVANVESVIVAAGRAEGKCWRDYEDGTKAEISIRYGAFRDWNHLFFPGVVEANYHFDRRGELERVELRSYATHFIAFELEETYP
jgi:hypothetical protein